MPQNQRKRKKKISSKQLYSRRQDGKSDPEATPRLPTQQLVQLPKELHAEHLRGRSPASLAATGGAAEEEEEEEEKQSAGA